MNTEIRNLPHFIIEVLSVLMLLCSFLPLLAYGSLEGAQVPIHFDAAGNPDSFEDRQVLIYLPILSLFLFAVLTFAEKRPKHINIPIKLTENGRDFLYANGWKFMRELKLCCMFMTAYISYWTYAVALGKAASMPVWGIIVAIAAMLLVMARATYLVYNWN